MKDKHPSLLELPPNRVRRYYRGGRVLDELEGREVVADGNQPENWLCSLIEASNPGMPSVSEEGLSRVVIGGHTRLLRDVVASNPEHYLGEVHARLHGVQIGFLAKLLDSSVRLQLQAHPTREFARQEMGQPWGKFECYLILSVRPDTEPYIYLGFQYPPTPHEWLRIVTEQDSTAMMRCFEKVAVRPGEVWFVPGGLPHALGEGLTLLEVMEPSDLVVRCEYERESAIVPAEARFMGRTAADALRVFDFTPYSVQSIRSRFLVSPELLQQTESIREYRRIGSWQIDCFELRELHISSTTPYELNGRFALGIVAEGEGQISCGEEQLDLRPGICFLLAASATQVLIAPTACRQLRILLCLPGVLYESSR